MNYMYYGNIKIQPKFHLDMLKLVINFSTRPENKILSLYCIYYMYWLVDLPKAFDPAGKQRWDRFIGHLFMLRGHIWKRLDRCTLKWYAQWIEYKWHYSGWNCLVECWSWLDLTCLIHVFGFVVFCCTLKISTEFGYLCKHDLLGTMITHLLDISINWWVSTRKTELQCVSNGVTSFFRHANHHSFCLIITHFNLWNLHFRLM